MNLKDPLVQKEIRWAMFCWGMGFLSGIGATIFFQTLAKLL